MTDRIGALIVDDEPLARENLALLLADDPEVDLVGQCEDGDEAVEAILSLKPDLVFLDVQMPGKSGFEVLQTLGLEAVPVIIFVTAFDQYAIQAFEAQALDYLTKPFRDERFHQALARAKHQIRLTATGSVNQQIQQLMKVLEHHQTQVQSPAPPPFRQRLMVKQQGRAQLIAVENIDWIAAEDYYVQIHQGSKSHLLRESLQHLETTLDPANFFRVHRSALVNLNRIKAIEQDVGGSFEVVLTSGVRIKVSRKRRKQLEQILGQRL